MKFGFAEEQEQEGGVYEVVDGHFLCFGGGIPEERANTRFAPTRFGFPMQGANLVFALLKWLSIVPLLPILRDLGGGLPDGNVAERGPVERGLFQPLIDIFRNVFGGRGNALEARQLV